MAEIEGQLGLDGRWVYTWHGAPEDTVSFSRAFFEGAAPSEVTYPHLPERAGDRFTCGPWLFEVVEIQRQGTIVAQRI